MNDSTRFYWHAFKIAEWIEALDICIASDRLKSGSSLYFCEFFFLPYFCGVSLLFFSNQKIVNIRRKLGDYKNTWGNSLIVVSWEILEIARDIVKVSREIVKVSRETVKTSCEIVKIEKILKKWKKSQ